MVSPSKKGGKDFRPSKVLLVSDFPLVRMGLTSLLASEPAFAVAGDCSTADEALAIVRRQKVDIVVLDLSLRTSLGLELVRDLRVVDNQLRILVTSVH